MAGRGTTTRTPRCQLARVAERSWTTGRRKDELAAGIRTEPTESRPPHSCEKRTRLRSAVHTQNGAGIGAGHVPRFSPDFVHVSGPAPGLRWPRSYSRLTTKMSPVSLFGRRRRAQIRTQSLSEPRSGSLRYEIHFHNPISQRPAYHRAALRFTLALASLDLGLCLGRPFAAKTIRKQDRLVDRMPQSRLTSGMPIPTKHHCFVTTQESRMR